MKIDKKLARVVIPIFIVVAIATVWIFKMQQAQTTQANPDLAIPLEITSVNLEEMKSHGLPIVLDFGADACVPCQEMEPVLVKLNAEMQGKAVIQFVDVWEYPEAGQDFPIQVIPTQVLINADGTPYIPSDSIQSTIPGFQLYSLRETGEHLFTAHQGGLTEIQMLAILADMGVLE